MIRVYTNRDGDYTGELKVKNTVFPDGTNQCTLEGITKPEDLDFSKMTILWQFSDMSELFQVAQIKFLLDTYERDVWLDMPFFPFSRQDHAVRADNTFALYPFCALLKSLKFKEIYSNDVHSETARHLLDKRLTIRYQKTILQAIRYIGIYDIDTVVFPDDGAWSRYSGKFPNSLVEFAGFSKSRDPETGKIISIDLSEGSKHCADRNVLVVDDICDGGATFLGIFDELSEISAKSISLFTTFLVQNKSVQKLLDAGYANVNYLYNLENWRNGNV